MPLQPYRINSAGPLAMPQQGPSALGVATDFAKNKAIEHGISAAFGDPTGQSGKLVKEGAEAIIPALFNEGGDVKGIAGGRGRGGSTADAIRKALDYLWGTGREGEAAKKNIEKYRPKPDSAAYRNMGGPMGGYNPAQDPARKIGDSIAAQGGAMMLAKGGDVKCGPLAGTSYSHTTKDGVSHKVDYKYHDANKPKPAAGGSSKEA